MGASKKQAERTRENVLRAGLKMFSEKGFAATRLEDIAKEAGVTRGAIYWHFKDKLELFCELFLTSSQVLFSDIHTILQSDLPPDQKIRKLFIQIPSNLLEDQDYRAIGVLHYSIEWTEDVRKTLKASFKKAHRAEDEPLIQVIETGKSEGVFRQDVATAIMVKTCKIFFLGLMNAILEQHDPLQKEDIPAVVACFLEGIMRKNDQNSE